MDRSNPFDIAHAIAGLNVWDKVRKHNWALVPQMSECPYFATVSCAEKKMPVEGRLFLFPGFGVFRDFMLLRRAPDYGVAMSPIEVPHFEVVAPKNEPTLVYVYEPGYVPRSPDAGEKPLVAALLYECYGLMLRFEENPDLPTKYLDRQAMFARKEISEGNWQDGPLTVPQENSVVQTERVSLNKANCEAAAKLMLVAGEIWEVDFVMVPSYQTRDPRPRFLYILAAVNAATGERMMWEKMSVPSGPDGVLHMWEGHAQRLLTVILKLGRVPGEIHVRSQRVMRFLRPLGLQLPFKLVQHDRIEKLDAVMGQALKDGRL